MTETSLPATGTNRKRRRRKQPRVKRVQMAPSFTMPTMRVPETARKRRKRNKRRVRIQVASVKRVLFSPRWISLFLCSLAIGALVFIGMNEAFYVTFIPVDGVAAVPPQEIVNASGLAGTHAFAVDPETSAAQIAELPGVISATVSLTWPNQVQIAIKEEVPIAIWEQDGVQYWISESGVLLPARMVLEGLLTIRAEGLITTNEAPLAPEEVEGGDSNAKEAMPLLFVPPELMEGVLALHELRPGMNVLYYDPTGGISFDDGSGWRVYFGTGGDMVRKMAVYERMLVDLQARNLDPVYVSVSNYEKPFYLAEQREVDGG